MIEIKNRRELEAATLPLPVAEYVKNLKPVFEEFPDITSFDSLLGGPLVILQSPPELGFVVSAEGTLLRDAAGTYDSVAMIGDGWYMVLLCTSNAGGTTWFIPPHLVTTNVTGSCELTEEVWAATEIQEEDR
jgi:hypothetical protein